MRDLRRMTKRTSFFGRVLKWEKRPRKLQRTHRLLRQANSKALFKRYAVTAVTIVGREAR